MNKVILASAVLFAASSAAWAVDTPLLNGSFEVNNAGGPTQTISNWTVSFTGTVPSQFTGLQSGLYTSYGTKLASNTVPNGSAFALISNLGAGTVTLAQAANFQVIDRNLSFRYAFLTNDAPGGVARDKFTARIDFFNSSGVATGQFLSATVSQGQFNDSGTGFSPFGGPSNNATATWNDAGGTNAGTFNMVNVDLSAFFGQFARVSFIVDNGGPGPGTNGNGLGVSGVAIDNVVMNPEPSAVGLFALGLAGLGGFAWRRRAAKKPAA